MTIVSAICRLLSVYPLARRPARDRYRQVGDRRPPIRTLGDQRMRQELIVVALGEIGALMGAARLFALQAALQDGLGDVEQEAQLKRRDELRIKGEAVIFHGDRLIAL